MKRIPGTHIPLINNYSFTVHKIVKAKYICIKSVTQLNLSLFLIRSGDIKPTKTSQAFLEGFGKIEYQVMAFDLPFSFTQPNQSIIQSVFGHFKYAKASHG